MDSHWDCDYLRYDEWWDEETGEEWDYFGCAHPNNAANSSSEGLCLVAYDYVACPFLEEGLGNDL